MLKTFPEMLKLQGRNKTLAIGAAIVGLLVVVALDNDETPVQAGYDQGSYGQSGGYGQTQMGQGQLGQNGMNQPAMNQNGFGQGGFNQAGQGGFNQAGGQTGRQMGAQSSGQEMDASQYMVGTWRFEGQQAVMTTTFYPDGQYRSVYQDRQGTLQGAGTWQVAGMQGNSLQIRLNESSPQRKQMTDVYTMIDRNTAGYGNGTARRIG